MIILLFAQVVLSQVDNKPIQEFSRATQGSSDGTIVKNAGDHLSPSRGFFGVNRRYNIRLSEVLFNNISDFTILHFRKSPSWGGESVLAIEMDTAHYRKKMRNREFKGNPDYTIVYQRALGSIYHSLREDSLKIEIEKFRSHIDEESVNLLRKLWREALKRISKPDKIGIDGTGYNFGGFLGVEEGRTHSPREGTKMAELVSISNELISLTKANKRRIRFDSELTERINKLIERFLLEDELD